MNSLLYFAIALVLSFLGTLPIGLITLTIVQKTINRGRNSGVMIALGATVMEFAYTFIALISLDFFSTDTVVNHYIKLTATIVFFAMGIYFLFKKSNELKRDLEEYSYFDFMRGIAVGAMNTLIVPFWIFLGLWLESNEITFNDLSTISIFSFGAAVGALLAFFGYILLSEYVARRSKQINYYTNRVVGLLFISLGLFQLVKLL